MSAEKFLNGKIAVVTGGANGIGKAIVDSFLEAGAKVFVFDKDEDGFQKNYKKPSKKLIFFPLDVTDSVALKTAFGEIYRTNGSLDILVNNAGGVVSKTDLEGNITHQESFKQVWEFHSSEISETVALNYISVINCMKYAAPLMIKDNDEDRSSIINISSHNAVESIGQSIYSGAKGAIISFSRSEAAKLRDYGIIVDVVVPGYVMTESTRAVVCDPNSWLRKNHPTLFENIKAHSGNNISTPEEVAKAVSSLVYSVYQPANSWKRCNGEVKYLEGRPDDENFQKTGIFYKAPQMSIKDERKRILKEMYG